jgi:hypothetical protein
LSRQDTWAKLALAILAWGCAAGHALAPPAVPADAISPGMAVTLAWTAPVDLDLYVTDPGLETVYFANPRSTSGGALERDARCADGAGAVRSERVRWTHPPAGRYRVGVDFLEACGRAPDAVPYRLVIDVDGKREELIGAAHLAARNPRAAEFTVAADGPGEGSR